MRLCGGLLARGGAHRTRAPFSNKPAPVSFSKYRGRPEIDVWPIRARIAVPDQCLRHENPIRRWYGHRTAIDAR